MTIRLRHLAAINPPVSGWEQIPDDCLLAFVPLEAVWPRQVDFTTLRPKAEVSTGYTRFMEGDVIVPKITPTFEADRSTWVSGSPTTVLTGTTELHVVRPSARLDPRYLDYLFSSRPFLEGGASEMVGVAGQKRVPEKWLRDYRVPIADLQQQGRIADYLDSEIARIDAPISKKRRLVELLNKRRQATITAVLAGRIVIDGGLPSQMHSRGQHPDPQSEQRRETRPLRAFAEVHLGRQRSPQHDAGPHMTPYLRAANVKDGELDLSDVKSMNFEPHERDQFSLQRGDVLVTEGSGSLTAVGASAVWSGEIEGVMCFQDTLLRLRPRGSTDPRFLAWWCRYAYADGLFASVAQGANIHHISAERVRSLPMAYVPPTTQRVIADYLDAETSRINSIIEREHQTVNLLVERRRTLITSVVTGEMAVPRTGT